jgi:hypothetical protein
VFALRFAAERALIAESLKDGADPVLTAITKTAKADVALAKALSTAVNPITKQDREIGLVFFVSGRVSSAPT